MKHVNLTRLLKRRVYLKNIFMIQLQERLLKRLESEELTLCDIGAGAGFPSLPLKIAFPQLKVTIVDSLNKRIAFLEDLVANLGITDVTLIHDRAETFSAKNSPYREKFDIVTALSVALLSVLSELCLPAAKVSGEFIAYKASAAPEELQQGTAIKTAGGKVQKTGDIDFAETEERIIIVIDKIKATPKKISTSSWLTKYKNQFIRKGLKVWLFHYLELEKIILIIQNKVVEVKIDQSFPNRYQHERLLIKTVFVKLAQTN